MKNWFRGGLPAMLAVVTLAPLAQGAGFGLYEGSARGDALGGTLVGRADDPSAIYYNPAGIVQLPGDQLMAGVTLISPKTSVITTTPQGMIKTDSERDWWYPPHVYYTHELNDKIWLGAGLFSRFGLGTEFPENWPGRYNSYYASIQSLTFNPDVALKLGDQVAVAIGFDPTYFNIDLKRKVPNPSGGQDLNMEMKGDAVGYGYNLGVRYTPADWLTLGLSYVSRVTENVDGTATLGGVGSTDASSTMRLPQELAFGITLKPEEKWSVEVGAVYTGWQTYDALSVDFKNPAVFGAYNSTTPKHWESVMRYQAGVEYAATKALTLRASYVYDEEPIPRETADYIVPGNDRQLFGVGVGYRWSRWVLDLSYTYLMIMNRTIPGQPAEGIYPSTFSGGNAQMIGLSLSTKL